MVIFVNFPSSIMVIVADTLWLIVRESNSVNYIIQIKNRGCKGKNHWGSCSVAYMAQLSFFDFTHNSCFTALKPLSCQNMYGSSEHHNYLAKQLASMGFSTDDELMALNLMVEKPSNIRAFKALQNDRDRKSTYVMMLLREHEMRGGGGGV